MFRRSASMPTYIFRVRIRGGFYAPAGGPSIWRELELAADQTLAKLGERIPAAFGFDDDHLWSFFLSGKPWDRASEYARLPEPPIGGRKRGAGDLRVRETPAEKEFLFLFDYGDEWHFGVKLVRTGEAEPGAVYPRVVASQGQAPPQYPDLDDEDDWDEEAARGDPAGFGPAEAILALMQAAGVDLEDHGAVDGFLSRYGLPPDARSSSPHCRSFRRRRPPPRPSGGCGPWSNGWVRDASSPRPATSP
jgi:hypothetical protein